MAQIGGFSAIFSTLNHQISLILHIMIDSNDIQQVLVVITLKKNISAQNGPIQAQIWPKIGFSANISTLSHMICLILHIPIAFNDIYLLMVILYAEQKNFPQNQDHLGPNLAQNGFFGHYLNFDPSDSYAIAHSHCQQ